MTTNRFKGVNPHLNSLLQTPGSDEQPSLWPTFHSSHINHIADFLNQQLPANYTAYSEQSLQLRGVEWGEEIVLRRPRPDISLFGYETGSSPQTSTSLAAAPTWEAAIAEVVEPMKRPVAVVIRAVAADHSLGRLVARIELLSPSNKPGGSGASAYEDKRIEALESGIPLIEIDYLHETPPVIAGHPVYPRDAGAYPYMIAVSNPRPSWETGRVKVYGFGVDETAPPVPVPLLDDEALVFDFDAVYQHTFSARRYYNLIDEAREPLRFHTYSVADQARIRQRMES